MPDILGQLTRPGDTVPYGLQPSVTALTGGGQGGLDILTRGTEVVDDITNQGIGAIQGAQPQALNMLENTYQAGLSPITGARENLGGFDPYMSQGAGASDYQARLSGAMGNQAQAQAFQQYQDSPGQAFLRERGERALTRNASALGGLGGGNVRRELVDYGQGLAAQDFENQFNRLGAVANRGLTATQARGGLEGNLAGLETGFTQNIGTTAAGIPLQTALAESGLRQGQSGLQSGLYQQAAGIPQDVASQIAGYRTRAGEQIAGNISNTTSSLANLTNQQGAGMTDIIGQGANNVNSLIQRAAEGDANAQYRLGQLSSNQQLQGAGMYSGVPLTPGYQSNYLGQVGQLAGGVGGLLQGLNQGTT